MPLQSDPTGSRRKHLHLMRGLLVLAASLAASLLLGLQEGVAADTSNAKGIVAEVNGKAITARELEEPLAAEIAELEQQIEELKMKKLDDASHQQQNYELKMGIFELKQKRLDELIGQRLLDEEAARRGMSVEELLAKEAYSLAPAVTDEQVEKFYERYKHRMVQRPEAELKQKARGILKKYRLANERQKYIQSLRSRAKVSTFLAPPVLQPGGAGR